MNETVLKLMLDGLATNARIEGMKAQNAANAVRGEHPEYQYHDFDTLACELEATGQSILACAS